MGVRVLAGVKVNEGFARPEGAVFYCSTTGQAFGPVMAHEEEAEAFLDWVHDERGVDPRSVGGDELALYLVEFRKAVSQ